MSYEKNLEKFYDQKLAIPKSKEMYKIGREDAKSYFNKTLRKNKNIFSRFSSRKKIDLIRNAIDRFYDLKEYFDGVYINKIRSVLNNADNYFEYFESSKNDDKKSAINLIEQDTLETIKNLQNDKQNILNQIQALSDDIKDKSDKKILLKYKKELVALNLLKQK